MHFSHFFAFFRLIEPLAVLVTLLTRPLPHPAPCSVLILLLAYLTYFALRFASLGIFYTFYLMHTFLAHILALIISLPTLFLVFSLFTYLCPLFPPLQP